MRLPFVGTYPVTQRWDDACCRASYAKFGMNGHNGIDYGLPTGTPVVSAHAGTAYVRSDPPGFGYYVEVHTNQYKTIYAHLSKTLVPNGQYVEEGKLIGSSGGAKGAIGAGSSTGPHLHFGLKPHSPDKANGFLGWVDPQPYLDTTNAKGEVMDRETVNYAYRAVMDAEPTAEQVKYWVGRSARELNEGLYKASETRRYKANRYDSVAAQVQAQQKQLDILTTEKTALIAANEELQARVAALEAANTASETPAPPPSTDSNSQELTPTEISKFRQLLEWFSSLVKK